MPPNRERPTAVELFCGGGGAGLGLTAAGFDVILAVEREGWIADCYRRNLGNHVICSSVGDLSYHFYQGVDLVFLSPPCQGDSFARSKKLETHRDRFVGKEAIKALLQMQPRWVILENVPGYRTNPAFQDIVRTLENEGYLIDIQIINFADLGVPQSRKRLILRATKSTLVPFLLFESKQIGWWEAIADLLPSCKPANLADWQRKRLRENPDKLLEHLPLLIRRDGARVSSQFVSARSCAPTLLALDGYHSHPFDAIFLLEDQNTERITLTPKDKPAPTLTASRGKNVLSINFSSSDIESAIANAKVVKLSLDCLKRLQTFPDWYQFPVNTKGEVRSGQGVKILGNSVPPEAMRRIAESFLA